MPNHVTNIITVDSKMAEIRKKLYSAKKKGEEEEVHVDFNNIIPAPSEIIDTVSPDRKEEKETEEQYKERINTLRNKYGSTNWYEWNCANWGTKWNAYQTSVGDNSFEFQTAWSHPFPFVEQLSSLFPTVRFDVKYADEDIGRNIGSYIMEDGEILEDNAPTGYLDTTKFACDILDVEISEVVTAELEEEGTYNVKI